MSPLNAAMAAVMGMYAAVAAPGTAAPVALCLLAGPLAVCEPGCWCAQDASTQSSVCRPCTDVDCSNRTLALPAEQAACCAAGQQESGSFPCKAPELVIDRNVEAESVLQRLLQDKEDDKKKKKKDEEDDEEDEETGREGIVLGIMVLVCCVAGFISSVCAYIQCEPVGRFVEDQCDPALSCPGIFQFVVFCVGFVSDAFLSAVSKLGGESLRLLGAVELAQLARLITAMVGVAMVQKRKKEQAVMRGCDCMCACPFPAWSTFLQLISFIGVALHLAAGGEEGKEIGAGEIVLVVAAFSMLSLDITFGVTWLMALKAQDGDVCLGHSKAPRAPSGEHPVVMGAPVAVGHA